MSNANPRWQQYSPGAAAGLAAYVVGYLVTYLWQSGAVENALAGYNFVVDLFGGATIPAWKGVGWLFYNAHFVAYTAPTLGGGRASRNIIASGDAPALLYLLPPLLLLAAGFVLARTVDAADPRDGAIAGARVTAGYLALAVLGLVAFRHGSDPSIHVAYATGILVAGVVYPLVFGAAGGALAALTR